MLGKMLRKIFIALFLAMFFSAGTVSLAQEMLPRDNGLSSYHSSPRYRELESHPLRIVAYALHPVGWLAREVVFRPISYFASSTELTRSVMGYREPYDYREPECFSADDTVPDCRSLSPFNYDNGGTGSGGTGTGSEDTGSLVGGGERQVYFPDVNFDFDKRQLNDLGLGRTHQVADLLKRSPGLHLVLQGHADYMGSDDYNQKLGMDRAEAVRQGLIALGVPADRLSTVTFGESQPLYKEEENWARAVNRRVEVQLSEEKR